MIRFDEVLASDDFAPEEFDALGVAQEAGAAGALSRIRQVETDQRWLVRYLRGQDDAGLRAVLPLYTCRATRWPDPAYDPATWKQDADTIAGTPAPAGPEHWLVVGGVYDRRTALRTRSDADPEELRALLGAAARTAAAEQRGLIFPFFYDGARRVLDSATGHRIQWTHLAREASFHDIADPAREARIGSRVRVVLRRDRRLIAAAAPRTEVMGWADAEKIAAPLIADHNARKGVPDHPEFVKMRYRQWSECEDVELIAFVTSTASLTGVVTAIVWRDHLELYEIGLPPRPDPTRTAMYLDLLFHQPLTYATARGLTRIRAGTGAETPKASRGAVFDDLHGGVLSAAATREVADGRP